jgi:hypothetical protein
VRSASTSSRLLVQPIISSAVASFLLARLASAEITLIYDPRARAMRFLSLSQLDHFCLLGSNNNSFGLVYNLASYPKIRDSYLLELSRLGILFAAHTSKNLNLLRRIPFHVDDIKSQCLSAGFDATHTLCTFNIKLAQTKSTWQYSIKALTRCQHVYTYIAKEPS